MKRKWTFKRIMLQIFATNMGRTLLGVLLAIIGFIGINVFQQYDGNFWIILTFIGLAPVLYAGILMLLYAWIINPYRAYKERKNREK